MINLRPVETIGLSKILALIGVGEGKKCHVVPERLPNQAARKKVVRLPTKHFVVADPLAVYWFVDPQDPKLPTDALGLFVFVPQGETIADGIIAQRFLVRLLSFEAHVQAPAELVTPKGRFPIDHSIMTTRATGPEGIGVVLGSEIVHAVAALQSVVP